MKLCSALLCSALRVCSFTWCAQTPGYGPVELVELVKAQRRPDRQTVGGTETN